MFQTSFPSIIRSSKPHIQRQVFVRLMLLPVAGLTRLAAGSSNGLTNTWHCMCCLSSWWWTEKPSKYVERLTEINKLRNVASYWLYSAKKFLFFWFHEAHLLPNRFQLSFTDYCISIEHSSRGTADKLAVTWSVAWIMHKGTDKFGIFEGLMTGVQRRELQPSLHTLSTRWRWIFSLGALLLYFRARDPCIRSVCGLVGPRVRLHVLRYT